MHDVMALIFGQVKSKLDRKFGCFELYGFDFMLDDNLRPYLLEINVNPALFTDTDLQKDLIPKLVDDISAVAVGVHEAGQTQTTVEKIRNHIKESNLKLKFDEILVDE